jgi:hypothetical protein
MTRLAASIGQGVKLGFRAIQSTVFTMSH